MPQSGKTVADLLQYGEQAFIEAGLFYGHGTDNAWDEAVQLLLHALKWPADVGAEVAEIELDTAQFDAVMSSFDLRLRSRQPAAYITGRAWFAGCEFIVDERALVPRSPIAELIERGFAPWVQPENVRHVLDLCTGGGCIGIACAQHMPDAQVLLSDLSEQALELAQSNIDYHAVGGRVQRVKSNLFDDIPAQKFDLIVSNPPYVDAEDLSSMPDEYHHEPAMALGAGDDGLNLVHVILRDAANYLSEKGILIVEVGNSEAALHQAYPQLPFIWLEFERGGHGVFLLERKDLPFECEPQPS